MVPLYQYSFITYLSSIWDLTVWLNRFHTAFTDLRVHDVDLSTTSDQLVFTFSLYFAFQLSVPMILAFHRSLIQGFALGLIACMGITFGQITFLYFVLNGSPQFIHLWFKLEPIFYFVGLMPMVRSVGGVRHKAFFAECV